MQFKHHLPAYFTVQHHHRKRHEIRSQVDSLKMAGTRNLLNRSLTANFAKLFRKNISSSTVVKGVSTYDVSNPALADRVSQPLSDALASKEKGPWTQLNKEDKIALYRSSFPMTMAEAEVTEPELGKVVFGVTVGVSVAVAFFVFLKQNVGPQAPRTITQEWRDAQLEKMKLYNMNPITGVSSAKK